MHLLPTLLAVLPSLCSLSSAAPATNANKVHTSRDFKLKSHVLTPANPSFENLYLEAYHTAPAYNWATLYPKSSQNKGIVGYLNGTKEEFNEQITNLLFKGNGFPYGFVIDSVNTTYNPIEINAGSGTQGIFIDQGVIKYHNPISGGFYACNNTLIYGPAVQVFYKPKFITTPQGCSDVELVVEYV